MSAPPCQLEIHAGYSPAGFRVHRVMMRDLILGLRFVEQHYTKHEAIGALARLSRSLRIPIARRGQRSQKRLAASAKFAAWEKRQRLVAQRAAKAAQKVRQ